MGGFLCLFSKPIINIFTDVEYHSAWQFLPLLTLAVIFQCMGGFLGNIFMAEKKSKYFFYSSFWSALTSLILTILLIKPLGLYGVCLAIVLSFFVIFITRVIYAWKHISSFYIPYYVFIFFLYILFVTLVTVDIAIYIQVIFLLFFLSVAYLFNKDDLKQIYKIIKNKRHK